MGAGKTSVGKLLARDLQKTFVDCDHEIERRTGVSIPLIFEFEGEAGFRRREVVVLRELSALRNLVVATGGGAVLSPENRKVLARSGIVVYLRATVDELWHRTKRDRNRPLLQTDDPRRTLAALFEQRDPLYREVATLIIDTGCQSLRALATKLQDRLCRSLPRQSA